MKKPARNNAASSAARPSGIALRPSRQSCIILGCVIGLLFAGGVGLYVWQKGEQDKLQAQVLERQAQLVSNEKTARNLLAAENEYAGMQKQLRYLETSVTAGEYVPSLLRQMEGQAKSVNLKVGSIRPTLEPAPEPPKDKEARKKFVAWPYDKIHIEMEVRGNYWSVAKLLYRLTEFPKIMSVESVQVQPGGAVLPGKAPQLTANLKLTGFIFKNDAVEEKPTPAGTAAPATGTAAPGNTQAAARPTAKGA